MSEKIIEYVEEAPGMVRIKPSIEGLLTADRYIQIARDLLSNGLSQENDQNLKDGSSIDLADSMQFKREIKGDSNESTVKTVVFSMYGKEYILNSSNIERIASKRKDNMTHKHGENINAIKESLQEMFTR